MPEYIARPKAAYAYNALCYGDGSGMTAIAHIDPRQKWRVRKRDGYFHLSRKGGYMLRLTEAAFCRLFVLEEVDNG